MSLYKQAQVLEDVLEYALNTHRGEAPAHGLCLAVDKMVFLGRISASDGNLCRKSIESVVQHWCKTAGVNYYKERYLIPILEEYHEITREDGLIWQGMWERAYRTKIADLREQAHRNGEKNPADNVPTFAHATVGDRVWFLPVGWGTVVVISQHLTYPLEIKLDDTGDVELFTLDGRFQSEDKRPLLFWDEFDVPVPPQPARPLPSDLPIDTLLEVRLSSVDPWIKAYFAGWSIDNLVCVWDGGTTSHTAPDFLSRIVCTQARIPLEEDS